MADAAPLPEPQGSRRTSSGRAPSTVKRGTPERRAELLDVAVRMFYEKGYVETTLQDIADEMGFTKPAVYYYAKNKEALLVELYGQIVTSAIDDAREIAAGDGPGADRFIRLVERHLSTFLENIEANAVFEVQRTSLSTDAKRTMVRWSRDYNEILATVYEQGIADGSLVHMPPRVAVNAVLGMCNTVHRWYNPEKDVARAELVAQLSAMVAGGLMVARA
jgi:AcrR family transcriptional regulator